MIALAACLVAIVGSARADDKMTLLTVVTSPEPQTQLMSMVLTMQSLRQGARVQMLLCGPAGDLALKDPPASAVAAQAPKDMSPHGLMKMILAKGGVVQVCALYLPNKRIGTDALLDGVTAAKPPAMAAAILDEHTKILSF